MRSIKTFPIVRGDLSPTALPPAVAREQSAHGAALVTANHCDSNAQTRCLQPTSSL
jgi:hypothetical protein